MDAIADRLIAKAVEGDIAAIKEFGDRVDGKPAQSVELAGDPERPLVQRIERVVVKPGAEPVAEIPVAPVAVAVVRAAADE